MAVQKMSKVFPLQCEAKNYAWGKRGSTSFVAQLLLSSSDDVVAIDEDKPYAELWMGTHPSGASKIVSPKMEAEADARRPLTDELKTHPEYLGRKVIERFSSSAGGASDGQMGLPFLFKVLSVRTPLSIQAHPNKVRAEELHRQTPDLYPDANHKPELAVSLTEFKALCGFRPLEEIIDFIRDVPELRTLVGESNLQELVSSSSSSSSKTPLKKCFTAVMTSPKDSIENQLGQLIERLKQKSADNKLLDATSRLILTIHEDFPGDVGCFGVYFLNYLRMDPGQALYLGADEAHAYLSGDCVEIMACSDNVVRAGLTPKFIDAEELCRMLTYECSPPESKIFAGQRDSDTFSTVFDPSVPDFTLAMIEVPTTETLYTFRARDSGSIILVIRGRGKFHGHGDYGTRDLVRGSVLFVPADENLAVTDIENDDGNGNGCGHGLLVFQAYCQL